KSPAAAPDRFPLALAERAHRDLLEEIGWSPLRAGMAVVSARAYEPLHALRDLDRALTREADFLASCGRDADSQTLLHARDNCRHAYDLSARHLVEKLFALNLLGQTKERDALLARAKTLPYLHDRAQLAAVLDRLDDEQARKLLVEPLLESELK